MNRFEFTEDWWLPHPRAAVADVLLDLARYPVWWPQVVAVASLGPDDARVLCRSVLPYTLDLVLHAERRDADVLETLVDGDLEGTARWRLLDEGAGTRMLFEQEVGVAGRWLAVAAVLARPAVRWNHGRMMAGCRAGLETRLAGRSGEAETVEPA
ncbi:SRPBCC family protein [Nocardioides sp. LHG3406-4]|uniref:SRPBCC family protein n=1 Tax=Nocardioides sp. LHG3406-4 TaxID=2804575 RepID=UPI003CEFD993